MDLDVLGFGLFGNEDVGEDDGESEDEDDDYQALAQPTLSATHPFYTTILLFPGAAYFAFRVMMARHIYFKMVYSREARDTRMLVAESQRPVVVPTLLLRAFTLLGST